MSRRPVQPWEVRMDDLMRFLGGTHVVGRIPSAVPVRKPIEVRDPNQNDRQEYTPG